MKITCINKIRNEKGVIVKYILEVEDGSRIEATAKQIKEEMKAGNYKFINLQIDKAGRLIDKVVAKRTPAKKVINKTVSAEDKQKAVKRAAREEVKKYIDKLKNKYSLCEEDLLYDYGSSYFHYNENIECRMTPATKQFFDKLVNILKSVAIKDRIVVCRYGYENENIHVSLPESVDKIVKSYKLPECVVLSLVYLASENNELAFVKCGVDDMSDGFVGNMILTANYNKAKEFILNQVKEESINTELSPLEIMLQGEYIQGDNMLGRVFVLKLYAEIQMRDANYYKEQVLRKARDYTFGDITKLNKEEQTQAIRSALRAETCGLSYLALKLGVLPQRDDWETPEEKEIEDKITAEAKRLAEETKGMDWIVTNMLASN